VIRASARPIKSLRGQMVTHLRIVARLDVKAPNLVKGVRLEGLRILGAPSDFAARYYANGADEIHYQDIVASLYGRNSLRDLVRTTASTLFIPLMVGGGLRSVADVREMLRAGADRVSLNTAAIARPALIEESARIFGIQCVCVAVEAVRVSGGWEAMTDCGRERTGRDAIAWAAEAVALGAGEILLTAIDRDGTRAGMDLDLLAALRDRVDVPILLHGGAWTTAHVVDAARAGASGVELASMLHHGATEIAELKRDLAEAGVEVRT